jgi:hypothetical protein
MRSRCSDKNDNAYGGRGIKVVKRWDNFENFLKDMGERPDGLTLERIDPNGDYCPSNCRWASWEEQENNRRNNLVLSYNDVTLTVAQWNRKTGIPYCVIRFRIKHGWSVKDALTMKVGSYFNRVVYATEQERLEARRASKRKYSLKHKGHKGQKGLF